MDLLHLIDQKADLAKAYAEDGAMFTAAKALREAAEALEDHGRQENAYLDRLIAGSKDEAIEGDDPVNLQGSGPAAIEPREG